MLFEKILLLEDGTTEFDHAGTVGVSRTNNACEKDLLRRFVVLRTARPQLGVAPLAEEEGIVQKRKGSTGKNRREVPQEPADARRRDNDVWSDGKRLVDLMPAFGIWIVRLAQHGKKGARSRHVKFQDTGEAIRIGPFIGGSRRGFAPSDGAFGEGNERVGVVERPTKKGGGAFGEFVRVDRGLVSGCDPAASF